MLSMKIFLFYNFHAKRDAYTEFEFVPSHHVWPFWTQLSTRMLALYRAPLRPQTLRLIRPPTPAYRRFHIQNICDGFLDVALALPIPPSFPVYTTTIVLVTLLSRLALLPISIWVCLCFQAMLTPLTVGIGKTTRTKSGRDCNARNRKPQTHYRKTSLWRNESRWSARKQAWFARNTLQEDC